MNECVQRNTAAVSEEEPCSTEYSQQLAAQICILAVRKTNQFIQRAFENAAVILTETAKTKKDYNKGRTRDFRSGKVYQSGVISRRLAPQTNKICIEEKDQEQVVPHPRVQEVILSISRLDASRRRDGTMLLTIDLSGQHIGDMGVKQLAKGLQGACIKILSLRDSNMSDIGFAPLVEALRTCFTLEELLVNRNQITDGAQYLSESLMYLTRLQLVNLSQNTLSNRSFWFLGKILSTEQNTLNRSLTKIFIGGNMQNIASGLRIVTSFILHNPACPLEKLHVPDSNIDTEGMYAIGCLILLCQSLLSLNAIRNVFKDETAKAFFTKCCLYSSNFEELAVNQCGLPVSVCQDRKCTDVDGWKEDTDFVHTVANILKACRIEREEVTLSIVTFDSKAVRPVLQPPLTLEEVVAKHRRWVREVDRGHVLSEASAISVGAASTQQSLMSTTPATTPLDCVSMLQHACECCLKVYTGDHDSSRARVVLQEVRVELLREEEPSMEFIRRTETRLQMAVGSLHLTSQEYIHVCESEDMLYRNGKSAPILAYTHFILELYPNILETEYHVALDQNIADTHMRRKDALKNKKHGRSKENRIYR